MPYRPLDQTVVLWDEQRRPYWRYLDGGKSYIPPLTAMQYRNDPRMVEWARSMGVWENPDGSVNNTSAPGGSLLRERGHWDDATGTWKQDVNWGNIGSMAVGGFLTAGAANALMAGGGAAGAGGGAAGAVAPAVGAETAAGLGAGGLLPLGTGLPAALGPATGGVLPLGTGLTTAQMTTPSFAALSSASAIPGIAAGTLPSGAVAPAVTPGMSGALPTAIPGISAGTLPGGGAAPNVTPGSVAPAAVSGGFSAVDAIRRAVTSPEGIKSLASLIPILSRMGGGGGGDSGSLGTSGIEDEIRRSLELSRKRIEQAQPVYDTLVNMAYGATPTRHRGAAPTGYTPSAGPQGAYVFQPPRFGGQR